MESDTAKTIKRAIPQIFGIWLLFRCLTSLTAAVFSSLKPITLIEKQIAFWPPSQDYLAWLNRVFIAPWVRYDAVWFEQILAHGYIAGDGSTSFHPLYILLSYPLYRAGASAPLSLLIIGSLATLIFLWIFFRLIKLDHEPATAWTALLLLLTFPAAFILFAPYTESLFLLWTAATLYSIRRENWGLAALFSFLAALTRQQGLFLALPLAWGVWVAARKSLHQMRIVWYTWLAPLAAPAGLVGWGIYRINYLHEGNLNFSSIQGLIYSAFLSSSAEKIIAGQAFLWPWEALLMAISKAIHTPEINVLINLSFGIWFLIAFIIAWKYLNIANRLYSTAIIMISFCSTTGQYAYISLPRHLMLALPVFIGFAAALQKYHKKLLLPVFQLLGMIFLIYCYVLNGWIP